MLTVYEKIQNACYQLNADAYTLQSKKRLRQFKPCEKANILLAAKHLGTALAEASTTPCACHNSLDYDGLLAMCFDDTARKQHHRH